MCAGPQLNLDARERLVFGGLDRLGAFSVPVNRWADLSVEGDRIDFQHAEGSVGPAAAAGQGPGQGGGGAAVPPEAAARKANRVAKAGLRPKTALEVLVMPNVDLGAVEAVVARHRAEAGLAPEEAVPGWARDTVEALAKYAKYLERQEREMEHWKRNQELSIPPDFEYSRAALPSLSSEEVRPPPLLLWHPLVTSPPASARSTPPPPARARVLLPHATRALQIEKLNKVRPRTFHEASQISGVTPHSLVYLYHLVSRKGSGYGARRANTEAGTVVK